jgi:hypothetical protein
MNEKPHNPNKKKHVSPCPCTGNSIVRSEGEILIVVIRQSFNIPLDLPYCIWGTLYLQNNSFAVPLQPYLPTGVTVFTIIDPGNPVVTFVYTDSLGNSDTIQVLMPPQGLISYFDTLTSLNTNYLRTELAYYNCNALPDDFAPLLTDGQMNTLKSASLYFQKTGGAGAKQTEDIIPLSRNFANQSQPKITELSFKHQELKPDTVWIHNFAYVQLGGLVTFLVNIWNVIINERIDMNAEKIHLASLFSKGEIEKHSEQYEQLNESPRPTGKYSQSRKRFKR